MSGGRVIVEVVGPAGSGKSTALAAVRDRDAGLAVDLYGRNSVYGNLSAVVFALRFGLRFRLGRRELFHLLRKCRTVENGLHALRRLPLPPRPVLVDEGPLRMLMDTRSCSMRERDAWRAYAEHRLAAIDAAGPRRELLHLVVPPHVRSQRLALRRAAPRRAAASPADDAASRPLSPGEPLADDLIRSIATGTFANIGYVRLPLLEAASPGEVADDLLACLARHEDASPAEAPAQDAELRVQQTGGRDARDSPRVRGAALQHPAT